MSKIILLLISVLTYSLQSMNNNSKLSISDVEKYLFDNVKNEIKTRPLILGRILPHINLILNYDGEIYIFNLETMTNIDKITCPVKILIDNYLITSATVNTCSSYIFYNLKTHLKKIHDIDTTQIHLTVKDDTEKKYYNDLSDCLNRLKELKIIK